MKRFLSILGIIAVLVLCSGQKLSQSGGGDGAVASTGLGSPGLILLEEHTAASSAELDFTTCFSSSYDVYRLEFVGIVNATNNVTPYIQVHTGGSYDTATNYNSTFSYVGLDAGVASTTNAAFNGTQAGMGLWLQPNDGLKSAQTPSLVGSVDFYDPSTASNYKFIKGQVIVIDQVDSHHYAAAVYGWYKVAAAVDGFRFLMSSGNITSGTVRCYGWSK